MLIVVNQLAQTSLLFLTVAREIVTLNFSYKLQFLNYFTWKYRVIVLILVENIEKLIMQRIILEHN